MKALKKVYLLYFIHEFEDGHEHTVLLGVFSSKIKAEDALLSLNNKLIQEKLAVYESRLERLSWQEGFATVD